MEEIRETLEQVLASTRRVERDVAEIRLVLERQQVVIQQLAEILGVPVE